MMKTMMRKMMRIMRNAVKTGEVVPGIQKEDVIEARKRTMMMKTMKTRITMRKMKTMRAIMTEDGEVVTGNKDDVHAGGLVE